MERFITEPTIEECDHLNQASNLKILKDPLDNFEPQISDLCFADSFLDFDSIKEFFEDNSPNPDRIGLDKIEFGVIEKTMNMGEEEKTHFGNLTPHESDPISGGSGCVVKIEEALEGQEVKNLNCSIEEEIGKVSLVGIKSEVVSDGDESKKVGLVGELGSVPVDGSGVKSEIVNDEKESESDSDSESESSTSSSSSSSISSSSSSDNDEEEGEEEEKEEMKEVKRELVLPGELEEGEIEGADGEEMIGRTDDDDSDKEDEHHEEMVGEDDVDIDDIVVGDENGGGAMEGPIRSKNELQVLPPVPQVNVTLQPHHQMLPIGVVLSVLGSQVIVEGVEKHNPLNEGSILWITESRSPLGLIDEIFGPVKNPYYMVRYNSESEIPAGIHVGTAISFVQEFANHILNDKNLYKKGYDASGENDEEVSDDAEFSDDEKEAEYKGKLKMEKRGMNDQKSGKRKNNRRKVKNKDGTWKSGRHAIREGDGVGQVLPNQYQHRDSSVPASLDCGNCLTSATGQGFVGGTGLVPQLLPMAKTTGFATSTNGVWSSGMPSQQPQTAFFPNGMSWPSQNYQRHPYQHMMNNGLFLQQFNPSQMALPNVILPGGQPNFLAGPSYAPWPGLLGQNGLTQPIGQGLSGQHVHPSINVAGQEVLPSVGQNDLQPAAVLPGNLEAPQQFNTGSSSSRGRRPYHRGGGRFAGRGRHLSK